MTRFILLILIVLLLAASAGQASIDSLWSGPSTTGSKGALADFDTGRIAYLYVLDSAAGTCRIYDADSYSQLYNFTVSPINSYTYLWYYYLNDANGNGHPEAIVYRYSLATNCYSTSIIDMSTGSVLKSWSSASYSYYPKFVAPTTGSSMLKMGIEKSTGMAGAFPSTLLVYSLGITGVAAGPPAQPHPPGIRLEQSYPNPAADRALVEFELSKPGRTTVTIYNQLGQVVMVLADREFTDGRHVLHFDGRGLPNGAYFYQVRTPDGAEVKRLLLIK